MPADLTATALANSTNRRGDADAAVAGDPSGRLRRFQEFAGESVFSSNVAADKIVAFDESGAVLDARAFCVHLNGGDAVAGEAEFTGRQGTWLPRRQGFENLWEDGRRFVYGAVNGGGMGTEGRYGPFCLIVANPELPSAAALAVFPGDSAQRYTSGSGAIDDDAAAADATAWADRDALGVVARGPEALAAAERDWPAVLCRPDHYLEVTRAGHLAVTGLSEVRVRSDFRDELDELLAQDIAGLPLSTIDANLVAAYRVLGAWRDTNATSIEEVP